MAILTVGSGGFATIQLAVNASGSGDTIVVAAGTYIEQVVITGKTGLTVVAADGAQVTVRAPANLVETARSSSDREIHAVVTVVDSTGVTLRNLDIDGHGAGNTVDEGGGAGIANFYGVFYRNASGTLADVDVFGVRDPYPGGTAAGGQPLVDGVQRGIAVVVDNDTVLAFAMHGGTISDFQKNAGLFVRADLDISGVTVVGGGAQTINAQNGFSIQRSTGTVAGNTITGIGYAGPANAYSGGINASSNFDLAITGNVVVGSNIDNPAAKVVGIWVFLSSVANSGGVISGNTISFTDVGIAVDNPITPSPLLIENNIVASADLADPYSAGVRFEPTPIATATAFDIDGTGMHDRISGNAGNDILFGLAGADALDGNGGNDTLDGGSDADTMKGGGGDDLYFVDTAGDLAIEGVGAGTDEVRTALPVYVLPVNVENLTGTAATAQDLRGNAGDNVVTSGPGGDFFRLQDGGTDSASGFGGNDIFYFGAAMTPADIVRGGADYDTVALQGDYRGGLVLTANVTQIEAISLLSGANMRFGEPGTNRYSYVLTTDDANFDGGQGKINGGNLLAGENFTFDGSAEDDARFLIYGGFGTENLTGGALSDIFFFDGGTFQPGDKVVGGAGYDALFLRGNYVIDFNDAAWGTAISGVENITLSSVSDTRYASGAGGPYTYAIVFADSLLAPGGMLTVNGSFLLAGETMSFDGHLETGGRFRLFGGAANDVLTGGASDDDIYGGGGADILTGGAGADVFRYDLTSESTPAARDEIRGFARGDTINLAPIDANTLAAGDQPFTFIADAQFGRNAGELRYQHVSGTDWLVQGDTDGDAVADIEIYLSIPDGHLLTILDFSI